MLIALLVVMPCCEDTREIWLPCHCKTYVQDTSPARRIEYIGEMCLVAVCSGILPRTSTISAPMRMNSQRRITNYSGGNSLGWSLCSTSWSRNQPLQTPAFGSTSLKSGGGNLYVAAITSRGFRRRRICICCEIEDEGGGRSRGVSAPRERGRAM